MCFVKKKMNININGENSQGAFNFKLMQLKSDLQQHM